MIIVNNEEAIRLDCTDVLTEDVSSIILTLENELKHSELIGRPGIGLAAPQLGIAKKAAIVRIPTNNSYNLSVNLINAKIEKSYEPFIFRDEGCLSFPGRVENTERYSEIYVTNNLVEPYSFIATGLMAVAIQHELDHINSILLPDRALPKANFVKKQKLRPNDFCTCGSGKKYKKCKCH